MDPSDLYGLPLERFTEERNALAKQLRGAGRREEAAVVAKLRKPSVAAWAVNQLIRTQRREIGALFKAGDALQKAQAALMAGRSDPGALRRATSEERVAVDALVTRARGLLSGKGHELSPAALEQVAETLHAAALDTETRAQVADGCLERELRHIGLGGLGGAGRAKPQGAAARKGGAAPGAPRSQRPAGDDRAADRSQARRREAEARRGVEAAERQLRRAREQRQKADEALRVAGEALATAEEIAAGAARELERARDSVKRAERKSG